MMDPAKVWSSDETESVKVLDRKVKFTSETRRPVRQVFI